VQLNCNLSNFLGQNAGYQATDAYQSNFFLVSMLGLKQMLIYQISLVESWSRATDANNSNFIWSASW
jgi:hypothetical protein